MINRFHDFAGFVEENVVHTPRVGTDAGDRLAKRTGFGQTSTDPVEQRWYVPVHPLAIANRRVAETGKFLKNNAAILERAEHHSTTLSAEIDG